LKIPPKMGEIKIKVSVAKAMGPSEIQRPREEHLTFNFKKYIFKNCKFQ
jgi:hypothetical protein